MPTEPSRTTVLVVDDEPAILALIRKMLEGTYRVLTAASAREAQEILKEQRTPVQLLLVDVMMPGVRGPEVVSQCRKLDPAVRYLYMSGYSDQYLANLGINPETQFIRKPFLPGDLLARVEQALEVPKANSA